MENKKGRKEGYYWVLINNGTNDWRIGSYFITESSKGWNLHGSKSFWVDNEFKEIDETPITRNP